MTIEGRGERARAHLRQALDDWASSDPDRVSFGSFLRVRARRLRNQRIGAGVTATVITIATALLVGKAFMVEERTPALPAPSGVILYANRGADGIASWHSVRPDGSQQRDLDLTATCAVWWPGGSAILTTDDAAAGRGRPLRPALVDPDGSDFRRLEVPGNEDLNLGCGDVSPDGATIALEGFGPPGHRELDGIYSIASDGGSLMMLRAGPVAPPRYSPDGTRLSYFDTKPGVDPSGSGALFVMDADGSDTVRVTPWGFAFDDHAWSPDGGWIVFQRPFGQLYLVRPDGSQLQRIPVELPAGSGALNPSWAPDGGWIVFSLQRGDAAEIALVRPDGSGLTTIPTPRAQRSEQGPVWAMP